MIPVWYSTNNVFTSRSRLRHQWREEYMTLLILVVACCLAPAIGAAQTDDQPNIHVTRLSERVIALHDDYGDRLQFAFNTDRGIIVYETLWSTRVARQYRRVIEREFGGAEFAYVLNPCNRLDVVGGNAVYPDAEIVAHEGTRRSLREAGQDLEAALNPLINMWRRKEAASRERLQTQRQPGTSEYRLEESWMNDCKQYADDLEFGYELALPTIVFKDRLILDMGDLTVELVFFGRAAFPSVFVVLIPEEGMVFLHNFIFYEHHIAPTVNSRPGKIDVQRWLAVLDEILSGTAYQRFFCGTTNFWKREDIAARRDYIRMLLSEVNIARQQGLTLEQAQELLSLDGRFAYVKYWDYYRNMGDQWARNEHKYAVRLLWLDAERNPQTR